MPESVLEISFVNYSLLVGQSAISVWKHVTCLAFIHRRSGLDLRMRAVKFWEIAGELSGKSDIICHRCSLLICIYLLGLHLSKKLIDGLLRCKTDSRIHRHDIVCILLSYRRKHEIFQRLDILLAKIIQQGHPVYVEQAGLHLLSRFPEHIDIS